MSSKNTSRLAGVDNQGFGLRCDGELRSLASSGGSTRVTVTNGSRTALRVSSSEPIQGGEHEIWVKVGEFEVALLQVQVASAHTGGAQDLLVIRADSKWEEFMTYMETNHTSNPESSPSVIDTP